MNSTLCLYKHNKTGNIYNVLNVSEHTETHEKFVNYQRWPQDGRVSSIIWSRPENMFFENVVLDGKEVPRFEKIENIHAVDAELDKQ